MCTDIAVVGGTLVFLAMQFPAHLLVSPTVVSGGDTPSHYYTLPYLTRTLLPHGRLSGWSQSHFAGFPILEFYFPLSFLLMAIISLVAPLQVAFKLGTVLGIFLLPPCAYACLRMLRVRFPGPALAAVSTLPFLFSETNSMWGSNISSVLAGEFAYSLALALAVLWIGELSRGIRLGRGASGSAVLLALIGFSHGYAFLFAAALSLFFLLQRETFLTHLAYLSRVAVHAGLLLSCWLIPLVVDLPWNTAYDFTWDFSSWKEVVPPIMIPLLALAVYAAAGEAGKALRRRPVDRAVAVLIAAGATGGLLYIVSPVIGVVDVRFVPFVQMAVALLGAVGLARVTRRLAGQPLIPLVALAGALWWVGVHARQIPHWIEWNYSGFEQKRTWPIYAEIADRLKGSVQDPRVVYEHSVRHDALGSVRAWESFPVFSGRSTLEHAYFQASPSAPFVFYLQSEISEQISCPFPRYGCAAIDLDRAKRHLELFNVRELIVISDAVKSRLRSHPGYRFLFSVSPYDVFATEGPHAYVAPLHYEPVLWTGGSWKQTSYAWFRNGELTDIHLVFPSGHHPEALGRFRLASGDLSRIPRMPIHPEGSVAWERLSEDEIIFETSALHQPHLVKVSYHPNWRVEGADAIYLVSPAFMMVYPTQHRVRLFYARSGWEVLGWILTLLGLVLALVKPFSRWADDRLRSLMKRLRPAAKTRLWMSSVLVLVAGVSVSIVLAFYQRANEPPRLLARAVRLRDRKQPDQAERLFRRILRVAPQSGQAEHAQYHVGILSYLKQRWEPAAAEFERFTHSFPDSRLLPEVYYHLALCKEQLGSVEELRQIREKLFTKFPDTPWAQYARERWPDR